MLTMHCKAMKLPAPVREYRFHPTRRWRFDYAFPANMLAIEIEGGSWTGGRHTRGLGFQKDLEKYNEAAIMGWRILRFTPQDVTSKVAVLVIKRYFMTRNG